jgi:hypothetical protein
VTADREVWLAACLGCAALLVVDDRLRRGLVEFKLVAHALDLRCLLVETRRKPGNPRLEIFLLLCHRRPRHPLQRRFCGRDDFPKRLVV